MKNYVRKGEAPNNEMDMEQNEQNIPMSYEEESYDIKADYSRNARPNLPVTQAPSRNQYVPNFLPNNFNNNLNYANKKINNINENNDLDNYNDYNINSNNNNNNYEPRQNYQHQKQQNPPFDNQTPIYVPPFLLNSIRPSRRNQHNAPKDYLPWSIANIFICVIIALPALFFSVQTRDMKRAGNIKKAKANSKRSLILNIVASVVGLLTILLAVILRFALYQLFVNNDVQSQNVPIYIAGGK